MEETQFKNDDRTQRTPHSTTGPSPLSRMDDGGRRVGSGLLLTFLCECGHKSRKEKEVNFIVGKVTRAA